MIADRSDSKVNDAPCVVAPPLRCRNCSHAVHIRYCPNCGQHIADHNTKLWSIVKEFFEEFIQLDSKFLRTVVPLIAKPGFLTRQWVEGKRVRYITPLKIYVTISAIAFLIISIQINRHSADLNSLGIQVQTGSVSDAKELMIDSHDIWLVAELKHALLNLATVDKKVLVDHYVGHLPTACLVIVPLAALFFSCLYIRRGKYYVEHLVFTLHFNSFCFLMIAVGYLAPNRIPAGLLFLWAAIYLFMAIKRNYGQGWIKTFLKFGIFSFSYILLIGLAMGVTAICSAIMAGNSIHDGSLSSSHSATTGSHPQKGHSQQSALNPSTTISQ